MTVTELGNGDAKAAARRHYLERDGRVSGAELARLFGKSPKTGSNWRQEFDAEVRNGAVGPVPVVVADVPGEAPSPARPTRKRPLPRKTADRNWVDWLIIGVVAAAAGLWSFSHIVDLAIAAGHGWRSYLLPVAIDLLLVAGVRAVGRDRRYPVAWFAIAVGIIGTCAGNVLSVWDQGPIARVSAAFPALALPVIVHLVRR